MGEREKITTEEAISLLPDGEEIHTFRQAGQALLGAGWPRKDIIEAIKNGDPELSGEQATRMKHGLVINNDGYLFIETRGADDE